MLDTDISATAFPTSNAILSADVDCTSSDSYTLTVSSATTLSSKVGRRVLPPNLEWLQLVSKSLRYPPSQGTRILQSLG